MNPPPGYEADALREVERDYADALRSLTFNNKPQIDALSQIADDHKFAAPVIVRLIERGLREVKPAVKLPYMYVMDSIMKNSREPYVELFSHNLPAVFRDTYRACGVVAGLQPKLERLFATWHSQRVLRPPLLRVIEAQIPELRAPHLNPRFAPAMAQGGGAPLGMAAIGSGLPVPPMGMPPHGGGYGAAADLSDLPELDMPLQYPSQQYGYGGSGGMGMQGMGMHDMGNAYQQQGQMGGGNGNMPYGMGMGSMGGMGMGINAPLGMGAQPPAGPPPMHLQQQQQQQMLLRPPPPFHGGAPPQAPPPPLSALLGSLLSQGVLSATGGGGGGGGGGVMRGTGEPLRGAAAGVGALPMGTTFGATALRERHDAVVAALYDDMPRQCRTCGLRLPTEAEYARHLDWHFVRRAKNDSAEVQSRGWCVSEAQWLAGVVETTHAADAPPGGGADGRPAEEAEAEAAVSIPVDEQQEACTLCGEAFEVFWHADEEEWHFRGAWRVTAEDSGALGLREGMVIHKKCRPSSDLVSTVAVGRDLFADMAAAAAAVAPRAASAVTTSTAATGEDHAAGRADAAAAAASAASSSAATTGGARSGGLQIALGVAAAIAPQPPPPQLEEEEQVNVEVGVPLSPDIKPGKHPLDDSDAPEAKKART